MIAVQSLSISSWAGRTGNTDDDVDPITEIENPPNPPNPPTPPTPTDTSTGTPTDTSTDTPSGGGGGSSGGAVAVTGGSSGSGEQKQEQQPINVDNNVNVTVNLPSTMTFKPKVGMLLSINNSKDIFYAGSAQNFVQDRNSFYGHEDGSDVDTDTERVEHRTSSELMKGTAWTPMLTDLPNIATSIARTYRYAVLCDDWFDSSPLKNDLEEDIIYGECDMRVTDARSETDNAVYTVERSWDNRDPGKPSAPKEEKDGEDGEPSSPSSAEGGNVTLSTEVSVDAGNTNGGGDSAEENGFYSSYEFNMYNPVLNAPSWMDTSNVSDNYIYSNYFTSTTKEPYVNYTAVTSAKRSLVTPYIHYMWYTDTEVIKVVQDTLNPNTVCYDTALVPNDEVLRAINILGEDILLRDEWVASIKIADYDSPFPPSEQAEEGDEGSDAEGKSGNKGLNISAPGRGDDRYADADEDDVNEDNYSSYFAYLYSNTSVCDTSDVLVTKDWADKHPNAFYNPSLITKDYIIQSIYRAVGVNCLREMIYFYSDKDLTIDYTPIARHLTVQPRKINQIQNRVDVFSSRVALDQYWQKALDDGIVTNEGKYTYNYLDAAYKPFAVTVEKAQTLSKDDKADDKNPSSIVMGGKKLESLNQNGWIELNYFAINPDPAALLDVNSEGDSKDAMSINESITHKAYTDYDERYNKFHLIDTARMKHVTLADFCMLLKRVMHIYGEEVMSEQEQNMLLVAYGAVLPYNIKDPEVFNAIKYLMAKGIVESKMKWEAELTLEDMLIILSRVRDKDSRLTFKEISIDYDASLLEQGFYPVHTTAESKDNGTLDISSVIRHTVASGKDEEEGKEGKELEPKENNPEAFDGKGRDPELCVGNGFEDDISHTVKDSPWIDYLVRMQRSLPLYNRSKLVDGETATTYMTDNLDEIYLAKYRQVAGKDKEGNAVTHTYISPAPKELYTVIGYEEYHGKTYLHFRVKKAALYKLGEDGITYQLTYNPEYVMPRSPYEQYTESVSPHITLCVANDASTTPRIYVSPDGGVYDTPIACVNYHNNKNTAIVYHSGYYESKDNKEAAERLSVDEGDVEPIPLDLSILEDQIGAAFTDGEYMSAIVDIDKDGNYLAKPTIGLQGEDGNTQTMFDYADKKVTFYTFDYANFDASYVDLQRHCSEVAFYLEGAPYLDKDDTTAAVDFSYELYDYVVQVELATPGSLVGDLLYNGTQLVKSSNPEQPNEGSTPYAQFLGYNYGKTKAIYRIVGLAGTPNTRGSQLSVANRTVTDLNFAINSYVKQNNTFLINIDEMEKVYNALGTYGGTVGKWNYFKLDTDEDVLVIVFDIGLGDDAISYNLYLNNTMHWILVNNVLYEVDPTETLFYQDADGKYWVNARIATGWRSGYAVIQQDEGELTITPTGYSQYFSEYSTQRVSNLFSTDLYTKIEVATALVQNKDPLPPAIPLSSPYLFSNYILFVPKDATDGNGKDVPDHLFVLKNTDKGTTNSVIQEIDNAINADNFDREKYLEANPYALNYGTTYNNIKTIFGVSVGSVEDTKEEGTEDTTNKSWTDDTFVEAHYELDRGWKPDKSDQDDLEELKRTLCIGYDCICDKNIDTQPANLYGKFVFYKPLWMWLYIPYTRTVDLVTDAVKSYNYCDDTPDEAYDVAKAADDNLYGREGILTKYYYNEIPLPIVRELHTTADSGSTGGVVTNEYYDISCVTYADYPYGTMPATAKSPGAATLDSSHITGCTGFAVKDKSGTSIKMLVEGKTMLSPNYIQVTKDEADKLDLAKIYDSSLTQPVYGLPAQIIGVQGIQIGDDIDTKRKRFRVYVGNVLCHLTGSSANKSMAVVPMTDWSNSYSIGVQNIVYSEVMPTTVFKRLNFSTQRDNVMYTTASFTYNESRSAIAESVLQGSLGDIENPVTIDWAEFTFGRLIHDIDNGLSIVLIIALNFIPRLCLFVFIILLGLSVIANVKPWQRFCNNVFDPYKFITFGHVSVETIDTKTTLITSMIAIGIFALFMDGTILHVFAWCVQFISRLVTM